MHTVNRVCVEVEKRIDFRLELLLLNLLKKSTTRNARWTEERQYVRTVAAIARAARALAMQK